MASILNLLWSKPTPCEGSLPASSGSSLSLGNRVFDATTTAFDSIAHLPSSLTEKGAERALKALKEKGVALSHPLVDRAYRLIANLRESVSKNQTVSKKVREEIVRVLAGFFNNAALQVTEQSQIDELYQVLKDPSKDLGNDHLSSIENVYNIVKKRWDAKTGFIGKSVEAAVTQTKRIADWTSITDYHAKDAKIRTQLKQAMMARVTHTSSSKKKIHNKFEETKKQASLLRINVTKMVLGQLILGKICGISVHANLIKKLITETNPLDSSNQRKNCDELFRQGIYRHIDNAPISSLRRWWAKTCYQVLAPVISFYLSHFIQGIERHISTWIHQSPSSRLETIFSLMIDPVKDYLTTILSEYVKLAQKGKTTTQSIDKDLAQAITALSINNRSRHQLLDLFTKSILCYAPRLNWAHKASVYFEKRAKKSEKIRLSYLWLIGWSVFFQVLSIVISPIQWIVNRAIQILLTRVLINALQPALNPQRRGSTHGEFYTHSFNSFLLTKLQEVKKDLHFGKDSSNGINADISGDIKSTLREIVDLCRQVLKEQKESRRVIAFLRNSPDFLDQIKEIPNNLVLIGMQDAAAKQIIVLLHKILKQDLLEDLWLHTLMSLNEKYTQLPSPTTTSSDTFDQAIALEQQMRAELQGILNLSIEKAIHEQLYPAQSMQRKVDHFLATLRDSIEALTTIIEKTSPEAKADGIISHWGKFHRTLDTLVDQLSRDINSETMMDVYELMQAYYEKSTKLDDIIKQLDPICTKEAELQESLTICGKLQQALHNATVLQRDKSYIVKPLDYVLNAFPLTLLPEPKRKKLKRFRDNYHTYSQMKDDVQKNNAAHMHTISIPGVMKIIKKHLEYLNKEIEYQQSITSVHSTGLKNEGKKMKDWLSEIPKLEVKVKPTNFSTLIEKYLGQQQGVDTLTGLIMSNADELLKFLTQPYHRSTFLFFIIDAYLKLPEQSTIKGS